MRTSAFAVPGRWRENRARRTRAAGLPGELERRPALPSVPPSTEPASAAEAGADIAARDALFEAAYPELRKLARSRLRHGGRSSMLQTTALVHESCLRLLGAGPLRVDDRRVFLAYASKVMRSVIIDAVRDRNTERHNRGLHSLTLDTQAADRQPAGEAEIMHVHESLLALEDEHPRMAAVVEMRYFGGYAEAEIAEALGVTDRTVRREWEKARLLLLDLLRG